MGSRFLGIDTTRPWAAPLTLFLGALLLRLLLATLYNFDGLYGQDPFAYYDYARELQLALVQFQPVPPFFWPIGYPLLLAATFQLIGFHPLAAQWVSMTAGAAIAPLVFLMVKDIDRRGWRGAWLAGLLAATTAQLMLSSLSIMSDTAALAWMTLAAWCLLKYSRHPRRQWLIMAAVGVGAAVLTRWAYGLVVPVLGLVALAGWQTKKVRGSKRLWDGAIAVLISVAIVGSQFVLAADVDFGSHTGDLQVVGWNLTNAFKRTVTNSDGIFQYERPIGLYYALPILHPAFIFPLLTPFLLLGVWSLRRRAWPVRLLLLGWPLVVYLFLAGIAWQNPRFSLTLLGPLLVLVGLGFGEAERGLRRRRRPWLWAFCALGLLGALGWTVRDISRFTATKQAHLAAAQWVDGQLPPHAELITFGLTLTIDRYTDLSTHEIFLLDEASLKRLTTAGGDLYLFVDLANIETQWAAKAPQRNLAWLQSETRLVDQGSWLVTPEQPYHLFQIQPQNGRP